MDAIPIRSGYIVLGLIAVPCLVFGCYVASMIVPIIVREVVPVVVQAVTGG
jgi:hypothetical protein